MAVTALPVALRNCRMIPLRPGTKVPRVKRAIYDEGAPWDLSVDHFLRDGGRVGIFMGEDLVGLDIDIKIAYSEGAADTEMVMVTGDRDIERLLAIAGLASLPRTLTVRTPSGGTHYYFRQNQSARASQCTIGCLDIRAARNSYLAIGDGYEIIDDGGGALAELPASMARAIMSVPHLRRDEPEHQPDGSYGNFDTAFNNALTTLKGTMVGLGWSEDQANEAIRAVNHAAPDPVSEADLESTVLRPKNWQPGGLTHEQESWTREISKAPPVRPRVAHSEHATFDQRCAQCRDEAEAARLEFQSQQLAAPQRRPMADVLAQSKPRWIIEGVLTAGVYGLAGPPEAGKSLLVRDWLDAVANGRAWQRFRCRPRDVTYVISEGHFDLDERFRGIQMDRIFVYDEPVMLTSETAVHEFIRQHEGSDTGLVVFDIVYDMGMSDDNGTKDVLPVTTAATKIAKELDAAVVLVGHPGHNGARRFKGSSTWRGKFLGEFHMSSDLLSCEKHKYAPKEPLSWPYEIEWPRLRYLTEGETLGRELQKIRVREMLALNPGVSARQIARDLGAELGVSASTVDRLVRKIRSESQQG